MVEDVFAEENQEDLMRKALIGIGIIFVLYILVDWFAGRIASKTARKIK
jgi:hypothetical protein